MNHDPRFTSPDGEFDPQEWAAQERALAAERAGLPLEEADQTTLGYRWMARALAQPPQERLPADFARRVARQAARTTPAAAPDGRFERNLLALLAAVFALAGVAAVVLYGQAWLPSLDRGAAGAWLSRPWLWVLVACLGLTGLFDRWWHPHAGPGRTAG